jgi:hypothetical protein
MWIFGRIFESSVAFGLVSVSFAVFREAGVGPTETLMTCSSPARWIESMTSTLKKSRRMDLSWI